MIHPRAYVHETAVLIGDVIIGEQCYIAAGSVLRGDFGRIIMEKGSNMQDTCVVHTFPGADCVIEEDGHIGHGAVLHGCRVGRNALVGMNSVVMDDAVIGPDSLVSAMAFVPAGFSCEARSLVVGSPARVLRELRDDEINWKKQGTLEYQDLVDRSRASLRACTPLTQVEENRPRIEAGSTIPKSRR